MAATVRPFRMIVETAVGSARECGYQAGWQGATTRMAGPHKQAKRRRAAWEPCDRAGSGFTQPVRLDFESFSNHHNHLTTQLSGQLPFLG